MATYASYISRMRKQWIGRKVTYNGGSYTVVDVDYNGGLLIDKRAKFTETTAVAPYMVQYEEEDDQ